MFSAVAMVYKFFPPKVKYHGANPNDIECLRNKATCISLGIVDAYDNMVTVLGSVVGTYKDLTAS